MKAGYWSIQYQVIRNGMPVIEYSRVAPNEANTKGEACAVFHKQYPEAEILDCLYFIPA